MRNFKLFPLFMVCVVCVFSCAGNPAVKTTSSGKGTLSVNLTNSSKFILLPAGAIEREIDMAQFLSAEFMNKNYFFTAWVKADENAIEMTFFNELGASIGELSYRNNTVLFSSNVIPKQAMKLIKPEYVIADFQLCFYNPTLLEKSLIDSNLIFETMDDDSRRILRGNEVIIQIIKTKDAVKLINHLKGYAYTLEGDFQ